MVGLLVKPRASSSRIFFPSSMSKTDLFDINEHETQLLKLKIKNNNEDMLLQFSLKIEMRNISADCEKVIIVTEAKHVRTEI